MASYCFISLLIAKHNFLLLYFLLNTYFNYGYFILSSMNSMSFSLLTSLLKNPGFLMISNSSLYIDCICTVFLSYQNILHVHLLPFDCTCILICVLFSLLIFEWHIFLCVLRMIFLAHALILHPYYLHLVFNLVEMGHTKDNMQSEMTIFGSWFSSSTMWVIELNPGCQSWCQVFIPTEPSH